VNKFTLINWGLNLFYFLFFKRSVAQRVYTACKGYITKLFLLPTGINIYTMVQVELKNTYININANNGSEKLSTTKKLRHPVS
jgi:hypothetical protein